MTIEFDRPDSPPQRFSFDLAAFRRLTNRESSEEFVLRIAISHLHRTALRSAGSPPVEILPLCPPWVGDFTDPYLDGTFVTVGMKPPAPVDRRQPGRATTALVERAIALQRQAGKDAARLLLREARLSPSLIRRVLSQSRQPARRASPTRTGVGRNIPSQSRGVNLRLRLLGSRTMVSLHRGIRGGENLTNGQEHTMANSNQGGNQGGQGNQGGRDDKQSNSASQGGNQGGNQGGKGASQQSGGQGDAGNRGFGSMDPSQQREIAAEGGRAAHASGNAHEFTSEEAREAGRMSHKNDGNEQSGGQSNNRATGSSSGAQGGNSGSSSGARGGNEQSGSDKGSADSGSRGRSEGSSGGVQGGTPEQHAEAGRQSHKND